MRIAIYGAGSLGTILGAYLARGNVQVDLITRNEEHIAALQTNGAKVVGKSCVYRPGQSTATLSRWKAGMTSSSYLPNNWKTNQSPNSSSNTLPLKECSALCKMACLNQRLIEILGKERVSGCTIGWGATKQGPGISELTSEPDRLTFNLGMIEDPAQDALESIAQILENMGTVEIEKNFLGARWSKLLINTAFSGMATVVGGTFGDVVKNKKARTLAQRIMKECMDAAQALDLTIEPVQGKDIVKLFNYSGPLKKWISFHLIPFAMKKHRSLKPSMLQDIEKDIPCEVEAINGVLSEQAKKAGVPTPINDKVIANHRPYRKGRITSRDR